MKKSLKKVTCLFLAIISSLSLSFQVSASNILTMASISPDELEPEYVSCPEGGKHIMRSLGMVSCFQGPVTVLQAMVAKPEFRGFGAQCNNCYLVLVTENNPFLLSCVQWGDYVTATTIESTGSFTFISNYGTLAHSSSIYGAYEQGFEFTTAL